MGGDRSLDEFLGVDADEESSDAGDTNTEGDADATHEDTPAAALSTTTFAPEGADCEACGATVGRRWRDGDALVCGSCKGW